MTVPLVPVAEAPPEQRPLRVAVLVTLAWAALGFAVFRSGTPGSEWAIRLIVPGDVPGRLHAAATVAWTLLAVVRPRWGVVLAVPLVLASLAVPSVQDATLSAFVLALVVTIARPRWGWHIGVGLLVLLVVANQVFPVGALVLGTVLGVVIRAEALDRAAVRRRLDDVAQRQGSVRADVRRRVARDLHDVVGHQLSLILMRILGHREAHEVADLRGMLAHSEQAARAGLDELRVLLDGLRSPSDTPTGLVDELDDEVPLVQSVLAAVRTLRAHGFAVDDPTPVVEGVLDPLVATTCRRILTEAVTNILRYAPAGSRVVLRLTNAPRGVRIGITNPLPDGTPERAAGLSGGAGLPGLAERVRLVGGSLTAGPVGDAWVVEADLPTQGDAAPDHEAGDRWHWLRAAARTSPGRVAASATLPLMFWDDWVSWPTPAVAALVATVPILLLIWRPRVGAVVALVVGGVLRAIPGTWSALVTLIVYALFVAGAWLPPRLAAVVVAGVWVVFLIGGWTGGSPLEIAALVVQSGLVIGVISSLGLIARHLGRRAEQRRERLARADAGLAEVRSREQDLLARELHDLVTRQLTLVSLQGMSYADSDDPDELHTALDRVESAAREALVDLRRLVGVLRADQPVAGSG